MVTLLVASGGGHLTQLTLLAPRVRPRITDELWVTYDTPQAASLLAGRNVQFGHPSTRSLPNAVRNYRVAGRILREQPVERVISTGAGIAVPFMLQALRRGIPCHYIESGTRVTGPSLSGRMLERLPRVNLYTQYPHWVRPRWFYSGAVFDGFRLDRREPSAPTSVLVSLGTHSYPFDRLVRRLDDVLPAEVDVLWQLGASSAAGLKGTQATQLSGEDFERAVAERDLVVGHAGVGLSLTALRAGRAPLLVPRRSRHGEHIDDHQAVVARELAERGLAVFREADDVTVEDLELAASGRIVADETTSFALRGEGGSPPGSPASPLATPATWRRQLGRRLAAMDTLLIALATAMAYFVRQSLGARGLLEGFASEVPAALSVLPLWLTIIYAAGGYRPEYLNSGGDAFRRFSAGVAGGVLGLGFASFLFNWQLSRSFVLLTAGFVFLLGGTLRLAVRRRLASQYARGQLVQKVLIVGMDDEALELARAIQRSQLAGYEVVGFLDDMVPVGTQAADGLEVLGAPAKAVELAYRERAGLIIVSPTGVPPGTLRDLTIALEGSPVDLAVAPSLFQVVSRRVTVESVANVPILHVNQIRLERGKAFVKRFVDVVVAVLLAVVTAPLMLAAAFAIRVGDGGSVMFRQRRVGLDGEPFTLMKFRTMVPDAEDQLADIELLNEAGHGFFKVRKDPRVTSVGRVLRKWSVDELPQLWNVLRGDMSMVGPRPPLPSEVDRYEEWQLRRLRVRPGITGVWQVSGRANVPFDEAVRLDLFYIENWSLGYDLFLLGKTVLAVIGRNGAY